MTSIINSFLSNIGYYTKCENDIDIKYKEDQLNKLNKTYCIMMQPFEKYETIYNFRYTLDFKIKFIKMFFNNKMKFNYEKYKLFFTKMLDIINKKSNTKINYNYNIWIKEYIHHFIISILKDIPNEIHLSNLNNKNILFKEKYLLKFHKFLGEIYLTIDKYNITTNSFN